MPTITLEPGGARPPTPTEQDYIRTSIGVATLTLAFGAPAPTPGSPAAQSIGQWVRRGTANPAVWDWYQWNGVAWLFVRRDGIQPGGDPPPYDAGALSGATTLDRTNGESQYGEVAANVTLAVPSNFTVGQRLVVDLYAAGNFSLDFAVGVQMPSEARTALPVDLVDGQAYRIRLSNIHGIVWLDDIEGPAVL